MTDVRKKQAERRNLLSSFFITLLIGLAYSEMISVVKDSILVAGQINIETFLLAATFFFISMRFFIGNQLHLLSDSLVELPGLLWIFDLMVIITQSIILIFLGGFSSVQANRAISLGFIEFLVVLYMIDITWIVSQWGLGKFLPAWKRDFIPWAWALLNVSLVGLIYILGLFIKDWYSTNGLTWLFGINLLGFIVDVILVDYYDAI